MWCTVSRVPLYNISRVSGVYRASSAQLTFELWIQYSKVYLNFAAETIQWPDTIDSNWAEDKEKKADTFSALFWLINDKE